MGGEENAIIILQFAIILVGRSGVVKNSFSGIDPRSLGEHGWKGDPKNVF